MRKSRDYLNTSCICIFILDIRAHLDFIVVRLNTFLIAVTVSKRYVCLDIGSNLYLTTSQLSFAGNVN